MFFNERKKVSKQKIYVTLVSSQLSWQWGSAVHHVCINLRTKTHADNAYFKLLQQTAHTYNSYKNRRRKMKCENEGNVAQEIQAKHGFSQNTLYAVQLFSLNRAFLFVIFECAHTYFSIWTVWTLTPRFISWVGLIYGVHKCNLWQERGSWVLAISISAKLQHRWPSTRLHVMESPDKYECERNT